LKFEIENTPTCILPCQGGGEKWVRHSSEVEMGSGKKRHRKKIKTHKRKKHRRQNRFKSK